MCTPFITENMIMGAGKESKSWEIRKMMKNLTLGVPPKPLGSHQ